MSAAHTVAVRWERNGQSFLDHKYSRVHTLGFDGGAVVRGSSSPHVVRVPFSDPAGVDPEETFVAALSSCHMLWFLDLAARAGFVVDAYADDPLGFLRDDASGKPWMAEVILQPTVTFSAETPATAQQLNHLHHRAHEECFLARAVKTELTVRTPPAAG